MELVGLTFFSDQVPEMASFHRRLFGWGRSAYWRDPDGLLIKITQALA